MRPVLALLAWALAFPGLWPLRADDALLKRFDGHATLTTADFTVPDGWEIRWRSDQVLTLGVIRLDHTVVAGMSGKNVGSLFLPQGGTYRIRVKGSEDIPWDVAIYVLDKKPSDDEASDYYAPTPGPAFTPAPDTAPPAPVAQADQPPPAPPPPPTPPPLPTQLSADQLRSVVAIRGDRAAGTGFFVKLGPEKLIVTTQGLIANNPNWKVTSANGNPVEVTRVEGATDRDVALLSVKDFGYPALVLGDPTDVHPGDAVLTGDSGGVESAETAVIALGRQRIEIDQLRAAPGGPVVLAKSGAVVGVVAAAPQMNELANFPQVNFDDREAAVTGSMAAFGLRLDNIPGRETYDPARLQVQAQFLDAFHQHSLTLDAYLNGTGEGRDLRLWQSDDKIKSADDTFVADTTNTDAGERTSALHALLFELSVAADSDFAQAQQPSNFYAFPGQRARDEAAYRRALHSQLDVYSGNVGTFNDVANRNNPGSQAAQSGGL